MTKSTKVEAFKFCTETKRLQVLDQTALPTKFSYIDVLDSDGCYDVIKTMKVRGAPCIAAVGCLSLATDLNQDKYLNSAGLNIDELLQIVVEKSDHLIESRPTAVNLRNALRQLMEFCEKTRAMTSNIKEFVSRITYYCERGILGGQQLNKRLGDFGANEVIKVSGSKRDKLNVLTHCNTGSLATVGYGTALGVIRSLHNKHALNRAYCTETRPYNQGSRLTAWELVTEQIPATLITDSMVAYLMSTEQIDAVLVGADCVAANGDTANKIGTLQIAITAKHFGVPFYVAAPTQSIDLSVKSQVGIEIEQRPADELRFMGATLIAPEEMDVWNPCFDVTHAELISGIITEFGVCKTSELTEFVTKVKMSIKMSYEEDYAIF